ncbi:MAG: hypothetical protein R3279_08655 [Putridiphycobacter sp.]|nr:hypothetical protein [Putridiphycobacter sp.]
MKQLFAIRMMLLILIAVLLFHLSVLLKIIPYEMTWGGRLKSEAEMYVFESVSIVINLFLGFILLIKGQYLTEIMPMKIVNIILWAFFVLFGLNTLGNVIAKTNFEKFFAIITLASCILIWMVLRKDKNRS